MSLDKLITPAGYAKLEAELNQLWKVERPQVTSEVTAAAALGDRSENAEYQYGKRRLREIDRRVRWLNKRMAEVQVVRTHPRDGKVHFGAWVSVEDEAGEVNEWQLVGSDEFDVAAGKVHFGAWVSVEDEAGEVNKWQLVGSDEFDVALGKISVISPIGQALLGKEVDDELEIKRPKGTLTLVITGIEYE